MVKPFHGFVAGAVHFELPLEVIKISALAGRGIGAHRGGEAVAAVGELVGHAQGFEASGISAFLHDPELPGDQGTGDGDGGENNYADRDEATGLFYAHGDCSGSRLLRAAPRKAPLRLREPSCISTTMGASLDHGPPSLNNFVRGDLQFHKCGPDPLAVERARRDGYYSGTDGNGWHARGV